MGMERRTELQEVNSQLIKADCCLEGSTEHEKKDKVYEQMKITENTATNAVRESLKEEILGHQNLLKACRRVIRNKGSHGIDGMEVNDLIPYFLEHEEEIRGTVLRGKYKPTPVRRVEIPKKDGTKRKVGVPTVIERVIQQAIKKAQEYIQDGYTTVICIDLKKYFDTVN